ncbi:unnamed protein product, partial [Effrenium voratum]
GPGEVGPAHRRGDRLLCGEARTTSLGATLGGRGAAGQGEADPGRRGVRVARGGGCEHGGGFRGHRWSKKRSPG